MKVGIGREEIKFIFQLLASCERASPNTNENDIRNPRTDNKMVARSAPHLSDHPGTPKEPMDSASIHGVNFGIVWGPSARQDSFEPDASEEHKMTNTSWTEVT